MAKVAVALFALALPLAAGSIEGRVTNSVTGDPVAGARVTALSAAGGGAGNTVTDSGGGYRLTNVESGNYASAFFSKEGYQDGNMLCAVSNAVPARCDARRSDTAGGEFESRHRSGTLFAPPRRFRPAPRMGR